MQAIAGLKPHALEANVFEWRAAQVSIDPVGKNSLIRSPELARSRQHAAAINPNGKIKGVPIFQGKNLRRELASSIE